MKHAKALAIKFIFTAIVVYSIFGIFNNASLGRLFWMSILITGIAYIIGDLFILRRFNYFVAAVADFGLAFLLLWGLGNLIIQISMPMIIASLFAAVFMTVCEAVFHIYVKEQVLDTRQQTGVSNQFQTEFADETNEHTVKDEKQDNDTDS